jgi:hypothetical protein
MKAILHAKKQPEKILLPEIKNTITFIDLKLTKDDGSTDSKFYKADG